MLYSNSIPFLHLQLRIRFPKCRKQIGVLIMSMSMWSLNLHREAFHMNTTKPSGSHQAQDFVFLAHRLLGFLVDHHLEYFVDHRLEYFIAHHLEYFWSRIFLLNRHLEYLIDVRFSFLSCPLRSSLPCFPFVLLSHLEWRRISIFTRFNDFDFTTFVFST